MDQRQLFLRDVLTVLFKHKVLIVLFTALVTALVTAGSVFWPPTYESEAKVRLMRGREVAQTDPAFVRGGAGYGVVQLSREDVNSEIELLYSNDVLSKVVSIAKNYSGPGGPVLSVLKGVTLDLVLPDDPQKAVEKLRRAIDVETVKDSHVLEIRVRQHDRQQAQALLAALLSAYSQKHIEVFSTPESQEFFDAQMKTIRDTLTKAQKNLEAYRLENNIVELEAERKILLEQYAEAKRLLTQLAESQSATGAVTLDAPADTGITATLSRGTNSTVVTEMQLRLLELLLERNRMSQSLGPKHPEVMGAEREIQSAQKRLLDAIAETRQTTERKMAELEARLMDLNRYQARVDELEQEVKIQSENYEYYAKKAEEARVNTAMANQAMSNIKVVSEPTLPTDPVSPRKALNIVIGFVAGLLGSLGLAFFVSWLDHGLRTPEDVEHYVGVPALASFFRGRVPSADDDEMGRLRSLIDATAPDKPHRILLVTSATECPDAREICEALTEVYGADPDTKAVWVDLTGDIDGEGLVDVVLGKRRVEDVMSKSGRTMVIARGGDANYPAHLWKSKATQTALEDLRNRCDVVLVLAPPVMLAPDALSLARFTDGALVAVEAECTRREVVQRAVETLREAKGEVLGVVLTNREQVIPKAVYKRM